MGNTGNTASSMPIRRLGRSGLAVSAIGLGCNNFGMKLDLEQSRSVVAAAIDAGITFFDTSDSYGTSEEILGELLVGKRDDLVIATKFGSPLKGANGPDWGARASRRYIRKAVESSLRRLRTEWIDLYQLHFPDPETPMVETLEALTELIDEGKIRYIGSSNLAAWQIADAEWISQTRHLQRFISAQNEYNLINRAAEKELIPACEHYGIGLLPYFPLASGILTGKYRRGEEPAAGSRIAVWKMGAQLTEEKFVLVDRLLAFADERGVSAVQVALGALLGQPTVSSVIAGATSVEQLHSNLAALDWVATPEDLTALSRALSGRTR